MVRDWPYGLSCTIQPSENAMVELNILTTIIEEAKVSRGRTNKRRKPEVPHCSYDISALRDCLLVTNRVI